MNDNLDNIPTAAEAPKRRFAIPLVWAIPIVAALIGGWIAVQAILEKGPTIVITFTTAEGLEAGQTKLKYKDVEVGVVRDIRLGPEHKIVEVTVELDKKARQLLAEDTRFWVVRARISGSQISGLSTLLSGSYIGVDPGTSKKETHRFTGLEIQPIVTGDLPGKQFVLHAPELGSLDIGAPVFYRRIQVGSIVAYQLDPEGNRVDMKIFVQAPYDKYVSKETRFWNASGIDVSLSSEGLNVHTEGLTSIMVGGIAFQTPLYVPRSAQIPAPAETVFTLNKTREVALQQPVTEVVPMLLTFDDSVRGLDPGAALTFKGVQVGEVTSVGLLFDSNKNTFHTVVDVSFYPQRLWERVRGERPDTREKRIALWQSLIDKGMRAQLRSGSLVTGQLYVALDFFEGQKKVEINWQRLPLEVPTMRGDLEQLQDTVRTIAKRLEQVPLAEIGEELKKTAAETSKLMQRINTEIAPELKNTLEAVQKSLEKADASLLNQESGIQQDARETIRELGRAAQSLRELADYLERHPESLIRGKPEDQQK